MHENARSSSLAGKAHMLNMREHLPNADMLWVTFDTLRFDVAARGIVEGKTPNLASLLPNGIWEKRHSPGTFTYAAHAAFFAGFLPTPTKPGRHPRLFASAFQGSETTGSSTFVFEEADIVSSLRARGFFTLCVGGVGFFNKQTALGRVFPDLFDTALWTPEMGVTSKDSFGQQVQAVDEHLGQLDPTRPAFTFINVAALHQPNAMYVPGAKEDSPQTQIAALSYVDRQIPTLIEVAKRTRPLIVIFMSDHGTAYGEDGYRGHRLAHPVVTDVPFAAFVIAHL